MPGIGACVYVHNRPEPAVVIGMSKTDNGGWVCRVEFIGTGVQYLAFESELKPAVRVGEWA